MKDDSIEGSICIPFIKGLTAKDVVFKSCEEYAKECKNEIKNIMEDDEDINEMLEFGKSILGNESMLCEVSANDTSDFDECLWDLPLRIRLDGNFKITFNKSIHGSCDGGHIGDIKCRNQTGMVLSVNETSCSAVIDIDIDKKLSQEKKFEIRQSSLSKLSEDDIFVESGSGGRIKKLFLLDI